MVATRRGARVCSQSENMPSQSPDVQTMPPTPRRTRSSAKQAEKLEQHDQTDDSSCPFPSSTVKSSVTSCTRATRPESPVGSTASLGSTHEMDFSDVESCSSVLSGIGPLTTRIIKKRQVQTTDQKDEIDELESCLPAVPTPKAGRSARRRALPKPASVEAGDAEEGSALEHSVTKSLRKSSRTRPSTKKPTTDEVSDAESCVSSVSGVEVPLFEPRGSTRSSRKTCPISLNFGEISENSSSPKPNRSRNRAAKLTHSAVDVPSPTGSDYEGLKSVSTHCMTTRRRRKIESTPCVVLDSESELTDVQSPRETPSSSRTGSASSSRATRSSRSVVKDLCIALKQAGNLVQEDSLTPNSALESTVIADDADCTLVEEDKAQTLEKEGEGNIDPTSDEPAAADVGVTDAGLGDNLLETTNDEGVETAVNAFSEEDSATCEAAVTVTDQQEELPTENREKDTLEMETMQETVKSSEPVTPCQSVTVTLCESSSENQEEVEEKETAEVDDAPDDGIKSSTENSVLDAQACAEEKMEISLVTTEAQQVAEPADVAVEAILVTSSQECKITVDPDPEEQCTTVTVQKRTEISLMDSSEDEDDEEEEKSEEEEEEEEGDDIDIELEPEETEGPSKKSQEAVSSVEGLFMIDTRPGEEADEEYLEGPRGGEFAGRQEKEDEEDEFVDEECSDNDDEEADILYMSRNPQVKEMSSRIDPGIRLKELGGLYINFDGSKSKLVPSLQQKLSEKTILDEVMKKSVIGPDFEKKDAVPSSSESKKALKLKHRMERDRSTGDGWFGMKAPEVTKELKGDLKVLQMRGSLDSKRFYKKNDRDGLPKYFQVGTVIDNPADFYHSRIPKKQRKRTMVEELLADAEFRQNNKQKFQKIVGEKAAHGVNKRNNKKNKFNKKKTNPSKS